MQPALKILVLSQRSQYLSTKTAFVLIDRAKAKDGH